MEGYGDAPVYTRGNNPTVQVLERKVALLEGADEARAFGREWQPSLLLS
jgi:O-acetylhomoserine/O-acetylserine sulfhydrylase-like pyridoxal-dependent enzyme